VTDDIAREAPIDAFVEKHLHDAASITRSFVFEATPADCQKIVVLRNTDQYAVELGVQHADWLRAMQVSVRDYHLSHATGAGRALPIETFHAKLIVADDMLAYVGSANLLSSSEGLSLETGLLVEGAAAVQGRQARRCRASCRAVTVSCLLVAIASTSPHDVVDDLVDRNAGPANRNAAARVRSNGAPRSGCRPGPDCGCRRLRYMVHKQAQRIEVMRSTTFTVRVDAAAKKRLERLAKSTGRSRSFLAAEAIHEYLNVNEWQVSGIKQAIASLDHGEGVPHQRVKDWVTSWGSSRERPIPKRS
jgi:RHH-type transcriptional regulator, rel operon repressor / antitoxin RelB